MLLEMNIVRVITMYQLKLTGGREEIRQRNGGPVWAWDGWCVLTTQPVRRGVHEGEISGECTTRDLIVILGVAPTAETTNRVWVPDIAILKVRCVFCPVPVRLVTRIVAFLTKGSVKVFDECAMPGEELASEVDDGIEIHVDVRPVVEIGTVRVEGRDLSVGGIEGWHQRGVVR